MGEKRIREGSCLMRVWRVSALISNLEHIALSFSFVELLYLQPNKRTSTYCVEDIRLGCLCPKKRQGKICRNLLLSVTCTHVHSLPRMPPSATRKSFYSTVCFIFYFLSMFVQYKCKWQNMVYCAARPCGVFPLPIEFCPFQFRRIMIMKTDSSIVSVHSLFSLCWFYLSQLLNVKARLTARKYHIPLLFCKAGTCLVQSYWKMM